MDKSGEEIPPTNAVDANIVVLNDNNDNDSSVHSSSDESEEKKSDIDANDASNQNHSLSVRSLPTYVQESTNGAQSGNKANVEALEWDEYNAFLDDLQALVKHKRFETPVGQQSGSRTVVSVQRRRSLAYGEQFPSQFRSPQKKWPKKRHHVPVCRRSFSASVPQIFAETQVSLTSGQIWTLICLSFLSFTSFAAVSIIAPFFPHEASKKGMTESVSGMVFAVYGLVLMVTCPLIGKILPLVGIKFVLVSGIVCEGVSNILFGLLDQLNDTTTFTVYCFVIRVFEGLGAASVSTASYAYVMKTFPDYIGTAFGLMETCVGLGMSLGPAIGGGLYAVGGYYLPFFVLGSLVLINIPICWCLLRSKKEFEDSDDSSSDTSSKRLTYFKLITIPKVAVTCSVIVVVSQSVGFLDPTVEPHLRQFGLEAQYVGLIFLLLSAIYAIFSPITGFLSSRTDKKFLIMLIGLLLTAGGLFLIGPSFFIPLESSVPITTGAMAVLGLSTAIAFIPTFESLLIAAVMLGYGDDLNTYSLVSGLWSSMYALGEVTGPFMGGIFLEAYGFQTSATIMGGFALVAAIAVAIIGVYSKSAIETETDDSTQIQPEQEVKRLTVITDDERFSGVALESSYAEHPEFASQSYDVIDSPAFDRRYSLNVKYPCCHHSYEGSRLLEVKQANTSYGTLSQRFLNSV